MTRRIATGDAGPAVRDVQRRLARVLGEPLAIDGRYGAATTRAVRRFQQLRGLAADGVVGDETWQSLWEAGLALGDRLLWRSNRQMRGDDVRELQQRLNALGFDAGPEDGIFDGDVQHAVEDFQSNVGLEADGVAGKDTIAALARLRRDHQSAGLAVAAREREALRRTPPRALMGTRIFVDPSHGPDDPGHQVGSLSESAVTWDVASRLAARLNARGAQASLSRSPVSCPSPSDRARSANALGADLVISIALAAAPGAAAGAATYYFGAPHFTSESGRRLAESVHAAVLAAGWGPDCRTHPVTWSMLRETRAPTIVCEPAFLTADGAAARLSDPVELDRLAAALAAGVGAFLGDPGAVGAEADQVAELR